MRKTRFIIPGYLEKGDEDWPQDMCKVRKHGLKNSFRESLRKNTRFEDRTMNV